MAKVSLKFQADTASAQGGIKSLNAALGGLKRTASGVGSALKTALVPLAGAGAIASGVFLKASKSLIDYGSNIQDLSDITGLSVKSLVILGEAFERAGMSMEDIQPTLVKMTKTLENPSDKVVGIMNELGLSMEDIKRMSIEDQFKAIGAAIGGISNQSKKIDATLAIFGKSGTNLLPLFKDGGVFKDAEKWAGDLAAKMQTLAPILEPLGDAIGGLKTKFMDFIASFAMNHTEEIQKLTDYLNNLNLTDVANKFKAAIESGELFASLSNTITKAVKSDGFQSAVKMVFATAFGAIKSGGQTIIDETWNSGTTGKAIVAGGGVWGASKLLDVLKKLSDYGLKLKSGMEKTALTLNKSKTLKTVADTYDKVKYTSKGGMRVMGLPAALAAAIGWDVGYMGVNELVGKPMINNAPKALPYTPSQETLQKRLDEKIQWQLQRDKRTNALMNAYKSGSFPDMTGDLAKGIESAKAKSVFDSFIQRGKDADFTKSIRDLMFSPDNMGLGILEGKHIQRTPVKNRLSNMFGYSESTRDVSQLMSMGGAKSRMTANPLVNLHQITNNHLETIIKIVKKERQTVYG